jgi:hypothetical protein
MKIIIITYPILSRFRSECTRGIDWTLDLLTELGTASNYSATANLHILQITPSLVFSVWFHYLLLGNNSQQWLVLCNLFTKRFLVTILNNGDSSASAARLLTLHNWNLLQGNSSACTTQKTQLLYCYRGMFTAPLRSNYRGADRRKKPFFYCCVRIYSFTTSTTGQDENIAFHTKVKLHFGNICYFCRRQLSAKLEFCLRVFNTILILDVLTNSMC